MDNIYDDKCVWSYILKNIKYDSNKDNTIITAKDIKKLRDGWAGKKSQFEPRSQFQMDLSPSSGGARKSSGYLYRQEKSISFDW